MLAEDFCCLHSPAEEYVSRTSAFRRTWLPLLVKDFLFPRGPLPSRRTSLTKDLLVPRGLLGHLMAGENHWQDPTPASFELLQVKGLPQILQMDIFWRDIFGTFLSRSKSSLVPAAFWDCHTFANVLLLLSDWEEAAEKTDIPVLTGREVWFAARLPIGWSLCWYSYRGLFWQQSSPFASSSS